jgi:uncharacterized membrane protein
MKIGRSATTFGVAAGLSLASAAGQATFQPLGFLGSTHSESLAISADGSTVVGFNDSNGQRGFRWRSETGMVSTGVGVGPATGVSADGSIVYGYSGVCGSYRWTLATGPVFLPPIGAGSSYLFCCSDDGAVAGGRACVNTGNPGQPPLLWRPASGYQLFSGLTGPVNGLSADGSVAAGEMNPGSPTDWQPFRWTAATGIVGLGLNPNLQPGGAAYGVSDDGAVIVGVVQFQPFRWTQAGGYQMLGVGIARAVNSDGSVIVGTGNLAAWVWTPSDGQQSLRDLLIAGGAFGLEGWSLIEARGVSSDGAMVAGTGVDPLGRTQAFVAHLSGTSCYPNCDHSVSSPSLNVNDFVCFQSSFAAGDPYADCDQNSALNVNDFVCFQAAFAAGCQ